MKYYRILLLVLFGIMLITGTYAQNKEAKKAAKFAQVKTMVETGNFDFVAQYANPQGGGHRYLNSSYDLKVTKDSLIAFLPYFGRAYFDVPYNPTDGGIKFTSTKFSYKATQRKKGGWDVVILPADQKYYRRIGLYISVDGNANVDFTITNKSFISFDGYIQANGKDKN